ncbi:MAG: hypothetical protein FJ026_02705 [Chloroflexi bacterium]|nr:hypothetical protein [Chloroflexota bacterium]
MSWLKRLWYGSFRQDHRWLLALIIGVGAGFRLYNLDTFSIWRDEAQTIFLARHSFPAGILRALMHADVSPPFYYFLLHFWDAVFGSDWGLRFLSVLFGLLAMPSVYAVGRRIFAVRPAQAGDAEVGLLAALAVALSPHHIVLSRTVRMYTILSLASLLALYFAYRFVSTPDGRQKLGSRLWWGLVLSFTFVLYTHNVGVYLILSLNGFFLWEILWRKEARWLFRPWALAQVCVALLYAPWVPMVLQQLRSQGAVMGPWLPRQSRLGNALRLFNELTGLAWPGGRPWLWMAVCALGILTIRWRRTLLAFYWRFSTALNLIVSCFVGPIMVAVLATPRTIGMIPSYATMVAFPAMCFLIARGVLAVRPRALSVVLLLGLCMVWIQTVSVTYVRRTSNLREIASFLSARVGSEDMIIIAPDYLASTFNYYYQGAQKQVAFPSTFGRVEDITWVGWTENWQNAAQFVESTLGYVGQELPEDARLWFVAPLGGYPDDPHFSQIRVLKGRLDARYGSPQVVDSFPAAVESAEVYIYR